MCNLHANSEGFHLKVTQLEMSEKQNKTHPLIWEDQYLKLLACLDNKILREVNSSKKEKLIRYQTLIIIGGYFGPRAKEFLHMSWFDVVEKKQTDSFQFKTGRKRKIYFNERVIRMIDQNYKMIDPLNIHHLILHKKDRPTEPVATRQFNESFAKILPACSVKAGNPSSHTLRKTFAHHIWADLYDKTEEGILMASQMLDHQDTKETSTYLGISEKKIKETYMRF